MILKRQEKDDIVKALYDSSSILASTYNTTTQVLEIIFETGNRYSYQGVSKADYFRLETAESQGKEFNARIKKYPSTKLEPINPSVLINEAVNLHTGERINEFNGHLTKLSGDYLLLTSRDLIEPDATDHQIQIADRIAGFEKFRTQLDLFIKKFK
jgi:hypothetical protein